MSVKNTNTAGNVGTQSASGLGYTKETVQAEIAENWDKYQSNTAYRDELRQKLRNIYDAGGLRED